MPSDTGTAQRVVDITQGPMADGRPRLTSLLPVLWLGREPAAPPSDVRRFATLCLKRLVDIVGSAVGLVLLAPLLIFTALAIRLADRGPALFIQVRLGRNGVPFRMLKFRTMHAAVCDSSGVVEASPDDPRITPLGVFLRRTSIDELPQLFNVLCGQMSFVGPRPHVPLMSAAGRPYDQLVPHYAFRHRVRPGITGWAQCRGLHGPTHDTAAAAERILCDFAYVQNVSLLLDIRIVLRTLILLGSRMVLAVQAKRFVRERYSNHHHTCNS